MRRRSSTLRTGSVLAATLLVGASVAGVVAASESQRAQPVALLSGAPQAAVQVNAEPVKLKALTLKAVADAQRRGADISVAVLDRQTGRMVTGGDPAAFPLASVTKLFIADDLLMRVSQGKVRLTREDRRALESMLRSSDDSAANMFWAEGGGMEIITRVIKRYRLTQISLPYNGDWWNTLGTTTDLVRYYGRLLDGSGGLPPRETNVILAALAASTPLGLDGYPQRFGIPDGLFAEPVAVKQGWIDAWGGPNRLNVSTGVVGTTRRYVIAIASLHPTDEKDARQTLTDTIATMFPGGHT